MLELRRPADVLIDSAASSRPFALGNGVMEKLALDIKVINALGNDHADPLSTDPWAAMNNYEEVACLHQETERRCAQQGITYVAMVFTAQGGVGRRAEGIIGRIAALVAERNGTKAWEEKTLFIQSVSRELARRAVRSFKRRQKRVSQVVASNEALSLWDAARRNPDDHGNVEEDTP